MSFITEYRRKPHFQRSEDAARQRARTFLPIIIDVEIDAVRLLRNKFTIAESDSERATVAFLYRLARRHSSPVLLENQAIFGAARCYAYERTTSDNHMLCTSHSLDAVFRKHVSSDGHLYVVFVVDDVFG